MASMNPRLTSAKPAGALLLQTPAELVVDAMVDTVREMVELQRSRVVPHVSKRELQLMELKAFTLCRTVKDLCEEQRESKDAVLSVIRHRVYTLYTEGQKSSRVAYVVKKIQVMIETELCIPTLFGLFDLCVSNNPIDDAVNHSVNVFDLYQLGEKERVKQAVAHSKALQSSIRNPSVGGLSERLVNALYTAKRRQRRSQLFSAWKLYATRRSRIRQILRHVEAVKTLKALAWAFKRLSPVAGWVQPEEVEIHLDLSPDPRAIKENLRREQLTSNYSDGRRPRPMRGKSRGSSGETNSKASRQQQASYGRKLPWEK